MRRLLLAVLLAAPLAGAERAVAVPGTSLLLALPDDWRLAPERGAAVALHPPAGSAGLAATVAELPPGTGPAAFARSALAELIDLGDGLAVVEHRFAFPIGVRIWSRVRYRLHIGPVVWEQVLWTTVDGGRGVCVTGSAAAEDFPRWLPVFERAVAAAALGRAELAP